MQSIPKVSTDPNSDRNRVHKPGPLRTSRESSRPKPNPKSGTCDVYNGGVSGEHTPTDITMFTKAEGPQDRVAVQLLTREKDLQYFRVSFSQTDYKMVLNNVNWPSDEQIPPKQSSPSKCSRVVPLLEQTIGPSPRMTCCHTSATLGAPALGKVFNKTSSMNNRTSKGGATTVKVTIRKTRFTATCLTMNTLIISSETFSCQSDTE